MDHREIAESIVKNNGHCPIKADCNNCQFYIYDDCITFEVLIKAKQWLKDNPKDKHVLCYNCQEKIITPADCCGKIICPRCKAETWMTLKNLK